MQTLEEFTSEGAPVTLLICSGWLTGQEGPRLHDQLLAHMGHGPRHLLLDLAETASIDHEAASILLRSHHLAVIAGCSFALVAPGHRVQEQLRTFDQYSVLQRFRTLENALAAIA
jgi:anti-anti-sigma regulatory factor